MRYPVREVISNIPFVRITLHRYEVETSGCPCEFVSLSEKRSRQIIPTADIRQCHPRKEGASAVRGGEIFFFRFAWKIRGKKFVN